MTDLLWPIYRGPADLAAIEAVPLAERGLPASTYHVLARAAARWPDRPAMSVMPDARRFASPVQRTYAEVLGRVHAIGNALSACGVGRGDAVALLAPNCADLPLALLASEAVAIAAPLNPALALDHAQQLVSLARARVMIAAGPALAPDVWDKARQLAAAAQIATLIALSPTGDDARPALAPLDGVRVVHLDELIAGHRTTALDAAPPAASDLASYFHTGGTTGVPKLAAHTHGNEVADAWMIAAGEFLDEDATLFGALPLFHVNALVVTLLAPMFRGQHVVWAGPLGYRDPALYPAFWRIVERYRVGAMSAVPTVYAALAQVPVDADIASLRVAIVGAAPLPPAVREAFAARTGLQLCEGYGLTEATCASARNFPAQPVAGSVGQRMPYQQIKAVRVDPETGAHVDVAPGERGVLVIRGPAVFPGYVRADGGFDTAKIVEGWLDTGDLGTVDEHGYLRLAGRAKDLIIRGGHNIDPQVIEDALLGHPQVAAANAVGRPDRHAGEVPVAYVVLRPGSTVDAGELIAWAAAHVPEPAAAPRDVTVVPALPITAIGKPFKPELRRLATHAALIAALGAEAEAWLATRLIDGLVVVELAPGAPAAAREVLDGFALVWRAAQPG